MTEQNGVEEIMFISQMELIYGKENVLCVRAVNHNVQFAKQQLARGNIYANTGN
jgi:hypothetical protein